MEIICFSELINSILGDNTNANSILEQKMKELNTPISSRSIRSFRTSSKVPKIETAINILQALNVNIGIEDLIKCIDKEREKQANFEIKDFGKIDRHVILDKEELSKELGYDSTINVLKILDDRVSQLYPDEKKGQFNKYIKNLIVLDLNEHILREGEKE